MNTLDQMIATTLAAVAIVAAATFAPFHAPVDHHKAADEAFAAATGNG